MKYILLILSFFLFSCKKEIKRKVITKNSTFKSNLTLAFGSCNNQEIKNVLFKEILKNKPKAFIWGGDIIYSDTDNPTVLDHNFQQFKKDSNYVKFRNNTSILATWDDHDYGVNDGGIENPIKEQAQQLFLDFLDVSKNDIRRKRKGIYYSKTIKQDTNLVKVILLDTRYFRTKLTKDVTLQKRYTSNKPNMDSSMLGEEQWKWLENELKNSKANFNIIMSSIQVLSDKHGFESWGNMPKEQEKLLTLIAKNTPNNTIILSGDRHIAEISHKNISPFYYPLIDFTSSGLTHAYTAFSGEENPFRVTNVVSQINFGLVHFNFKKKKVLFEIRGKNNQLLESFEQQY